MGFNSAFKELKQILIDGLIFAQDRQRWRAVMRKVTNLRVP